MLYALQSAADSVHTITVYDDIGKLPIFSADLEHPEPPQEVAKFVRAIADSEGLIIASPEYVRSMPGGLKTLSTGLCHVMR